MRNSGITLTVSKPKTEIRKKTFAYAGASLWNSMPTHIKTARNIVQFKKLVKEFIVAKRL